MNITIHITGLEEITTAIQNLAGAMGSKNLLQHTPETVPTPSLTLPSPPVTPVMKNPDPTPAPLPTQVPVSPPASFRIEQLQVAAATLADQGKQQAIIALLAQYGADRITALDPQHFGAFATAIRGLGGMI